MKQIRTKSTEYFIDKIDEHMIDKTNQEVFSIDPYASKDFDVPDPYFGGDKGFEDVYHMLNRSCEMLLTMLENK